MAGFVGNRLKNRLLIAPINSLCFTLVKPIFIFSGMLIFVAGCDSPIGNCPAGLEKIGKKCVNTYLQIYENVVEYGDQAIIKAENYQTVKDLEKAQAELSYAFLELSQIPEDATIFMEVDQKRKQYEGEGQKIAQSIEQEETALQYLEEAEKAEKFAQAQSMGDRTIDELNAARKSWQKAIAILEQVPLNTLAANQVNQFKNQYTEQIAGIDLRLNNMNEVISPIMRSSPQNSTPEIFNDSCAESNPPDNCVF